MGPASLSLRCLAACHCCLQGLDHCSEGPAELKLCCLAASLCHPQGLKRCLAGLESRAGAQRERALPQRSRPWVQSRMLRSCGWLMWAAGHIARAGGAAGVARGDVQRKPTQRCCCLQAPPTFGCHSWRGPVVGPSTLPAAAIALTAWPAMGGMSWKHTAGPRTGAAAGCCAAAAAGVSAAPAVRWGCGTAAAAGAALGWKQKAQAHARNVPQ